MSRDIRAFVWFCFGVMISFAMMVPVYASTYPVQPPFVSTGSDGLSYYSPPRGGTVYNGSTGSPIIVTAPSNSVPGTGPVTITYPSSSTTSPLKVPIPAPPGGTASTQLMQIPTTISPNALRVASAVVGFSRFAGPVGIGLNLANLLCTNTQLCQLPGQNGQPAPNEFGYQKTPYVIPTRVYGMGSSTIVDGPTHYAAQQSYCHLYSPTDTVVPNTCDQTNKMDYCTFQCINNGQIGGGGGTTFKSQSCPVGYVLDSNFNCIGSPETVTPTDENWATILTKLSTLTTKMADMVTGLQDKGQPVPIDKPTLTPSSVTSPGQSVVNRDATGNVTNTTTTTTTTTNTPVTNNTTTNTTNITQTTITTVTNNTGDTTSTTTTTAEPKPPEEPPEDPTIEFDEVPETPLPEQQLPLSLTTNSWGEGNCPPDPSLTVMGTQMTVPVHVVCGYMSAVRPAVIAFFGLIAAYIVVGVKFEG